MKIVPERTHFMVAGMLLSLAAPAEAETHIIKMRNADAADPNQTNVFDPPLLHIQPGDSVKFVVVDPGHNVASKKGMIPDGASAWNGKIDEEVEITFDADGTYGYLCLPHYEMGMVGLILVGNYLANFEAAKTVRHPGQARKAFRELFKAVEESH